MGLTRSKVLYGLCLTKLRRWLVFIVLSCSAFAWSDWALAKNKAGAISNQVGSKPATFGLGVGIGSGLSGPSLYYPARGKFTYQGMIGIGGVTGYGISGDALLPMAYKFPDWMRPYYGFGVILLRGPRILLSGSIDSDAMAMGARVPVGMNAQVGQTRFQVGGELVPTAYIMPGFALGLDVLVAARYLF